jgi:S-adenosylmethionine hydrolase
MAVRPTPPIITLTTDFGNSDHYVGTMKGVILSRCPQARIVDISHEIPPFSILAGAYTIAQSAPFFPAGTIHIVVVDPGVGSQRKAMLAGAGGQLFIAPDNGVLSLILEEKEPSIVREISNRKLWLESPSQTFHGRDLFAPAGALIASGDVSLAEVGPTLQNAELLPNLNPQNIDSNHWLGLALHVDRFGNVITNFRFRTFGSTNSFTITCKSREISQFYPSFSLAPKGTLFAYPGSSGYIEIGINQQSAAEELGIRPGDSITLRTPEI